MGDRQEARPSTSAPSGTAALAYHRRGSSFAVQVSKRLHTPSHHDLQSSFYADASAVPGVEAVEAGQEGRPEEVLVRRRTPLSRMARRP